VAATPIPNPLLKEIETARVGHNPRANTKVGFSLMMPFTNSAKSFFMILPVLFLLKI